MKKMYSLYFVLLAGSLVLNAPVHFALSADGDVSSDSTFQTTQSAFQSDDSNSSVSEDLDHGGPGHPGGPSGPGHPGGPGGPGGPHPGQPQPPHPVQPQPPRPQPPHPVGPTPPHPGQPHPGQPYPAPHPGQPRPGGFHPGDPGRTYDPYPITAGGDPWPRWNHPPFQRPVYGWNWDQLRTVTCEAGDSNGDVYPVTYSDYIGVQYEAQLADIEDTALDECYADTDGLGNCYLIGCTPGY